MSCEYKDFYLPSVLFLHLITSASWAPICHPHSDSWMSLVVRMPYTFKFQKLSSSSPLNDIPPNTSVHIRTATLSSFASSF